MSPAAVRVIINDGATQAMLRSPAGPPARHVIVVGEKVKQEAIRTAPRVTGNLAAHIVKRITTQGGETVVLVGIENVPYAIWVVQGANPHPIVARRARVLVFFWERMGELVAFPSVQHPGNQPNRFLQTAVQTVARQGANAA